MSEKIIPGKAALLVEDEGIKILVIADLHLTGEDDDVYTLIDNVKSLIKEYKPNLLIVNGDIFNFNTGGESVEIFETELSKIILLKIIQGNHDPEVFVPFQTSKNYIFCHGDYDFGMPQKNLVLAHTHPYLDEKRVFLKGTLKDGRKFTIIPPFNEKVGGPEITDKDFLLGFVFAKDAVKDCLVYDLKGKKIAKLN